MYSIVENNIITFSSRSNLSATRKLRRRAHIHYTHECNIMIIFKLLSWHALLHGAPIFRVFFFLLYNDIVFLQTKKPHAFRNILEHYKSTKDLYYICIVKILNTSRIHTWAIKHFPVNCMLPPEDDITLKRKRSLQCHIISHKYD